MKAHEQFEELLWSGESLNENQTAALQEHLESCRDCQDLKEAWEDFHGVVQRTRIETAPPDFTSRWKKDLTERKMLARKIQSRRIALISSAGTFFSFLAAVGLTLYISTPADLIVGFIRSASGLITLVNELRTVVTSLIQIIPPIIPVFYWLALTSIFSFLAVLWMLSIWRIAKQGVYLK